MKRIAICAAALTALGGCAMSPADRARQAAAAEREQAELAEALEGLTPVSTENCIQSSGIHSTDVVAESMLFRRSNSHIYRSEVGPGCNRAGDDILVFKSLIGSQYCQGDIVRTQSRSGGFLTGSCSLGEFTEYRRNDR